MHLKLYLMPALLLTINVALAQQTTPPSSAVAATNSEGRINTVQPKIMVMPYAKEGEDIRTVLEADFNKQIAVAKVKEAFDARDFTTVDFVTSLKRAIQSGVFTKAKSQTDLQTEIAMMGGADIYVTVNSNLTSCGGGASIFRVILEGNDVNSGNALSSQVGESPCNQADAGKLAQKAIESKIEPFLVTMNRKFDDIVKNGVPVTVDISLGKNSALTDLSQEVGSNKKQLSEAIEDWFSQNAYHNDYTVAFTTDVKMLIDPVKIPLRDQTNRSNYNATKFSREIEKFLQGYGLKTNRVVNRNRIFITIN